ncbi:MAG: hypothetical protein HZA36_01690 [Parcubacteria group bacterium]|nr:hypothetical protein [Parcubacteria group bacterium]
MGIDARPGGFGNNEDSSADKKIRELRGKLAELNELSVRIDQDRIEKQRKLKEENAEKTREEEHEVFMASEEDKGHIRLRYREKRDERMAEFTQTLKDSTEQGKDIGRRKSAIQEQIFRIEDQQKEKPRTAREVKDMRTETLKKPPETIEHQKNIIDTTGKKKEALLGKMKAYFKRLLGGK